MKSFQLLVAAIFAAFASFAQISGPTTICLGSSGTYTSTTTGGSWSVSPLTVVTIGSASGIVTGINAGTAIISYTAGSVVTTYPITVNPLPPAITGVSAVCSGSSGTLTNAASGGTWSSTPSAQGTIGLTSGIFIGGTPGTATVTYTLGSTGCSATKVITVNPNPAAITGPSSVCSGSSITLSGSSGVTFTSSNTALGTVGSVTGVVTGISSGVLTITTTLPTGCIATKAVTVMATPSAITTSVAWPWAVCVGSTLAFSNTTTGGTWSSSNTAVGTISTGGVLAGLSGGTTAISYTLGTGCFTTDNAYVLLTSPSAFTVTGGGSYCSGGTGVAVGLSSSQTGVLYQLLRGGSPAGPPVSGTGSAINFGLQTIAGTYTVVANSGTSCSATMSGSVVVTVNPLPNIFTMVGGTACAGGSGVTIGLNSSQIGVRYDLYLNGTYTGTNVAGTGAAIAFGTFTSTGIYTIVASNTTTSCTRNMTGSATIVTTASMYSVTGGGGYCAGGTGVLVGLSGSAAGVPYQLYNGTTAVGSPVTGTGTAITFGLQTAAGTYTAVAFPGTSCATTMSGSATVAINPLPVAFTLSSGGATCSSGPGINICLSGSQTGVNYQLMLGSSPVGSAIAGTGSMVCFGFITTAGTYTVRGTNTATGCVSTMSGSATVTVTAGPASITGTATVCVGGTTTLGNTTPGGTWSSSNPSVATINFSGVVSGSAAGTTTISYTIPSTGCVASRTVTVYSTPSVFSVSGGGTFCAGASTAIGVSGSQTGVSYQLYNGSTPVGSPVSGTGSALSFSISAAAGTYTVVGNPGTTCATTMTGSAVIVTNPLPTAFTVTGSGGFCAGGPGRTLGLSGSQTGVNYQLLLGTTAIGSPVAGTGAAISFGLHFTAGTYTVIATDATTGCTRTMTGTGTITVNPAPTLYTITGGGSFCSGGSGVLIGLSGSQTGVTYQLLNGTSPVGGALSGTGTPLSFGLIATPGTTYTVLALASTGCGATMTGSVSVTLLTSATVYAVTGGGTYCTGGSGLPIGLSNSQTGVSYQLYSGTTPTGAPVAGTGSAISFGMFTTTGTYTVVANPGTSCAATMSGSATIATSPSPTMFTVTGGGTICAGSPGFTLGLSGSQTGVSYQLYNGTIPSGTALPGTGSPLSFGVISTAGTYTVIADPGTTCATAMSGSAVIVVNPSPTAFTVTGGVSCTSAGVIVGLTGSQTGISYRLYRGATPGAAITGTGAAISFGLQTMAGLYTVVATDLTTGCTATMTGSASMSTGSIPALFTVTGGGSYCAGGSGVVVGLSGSTALVSYQLYRGTTPVGSAITGAGAPISFGLHTIAGTYTVVATNMVSGCTRNMNASAVITINPLPTAFTVTGGGSYCTGGTGVLIGLSGSARGISYRLYRGTLNVATLAGTGSAISFGLHTIAGTYTVIAYNGGTTCTNTMTGSATISINPLPTAYTVSGGGIYCSGAGYNITLSSSDTGVSYRLYLGAIATGSPVTGTGSMISFGLFTTAGTYTVRATNTTTSCTRTMSGSAVISAGAVPTVFTVTGGGGYCAGGAGANVGLSGSTAGISYKLYRGGTTLVATITGTGTAISFGPQTVAGIYTATATNTTTTCTSNMAGSATVSVNPLPNVYAMGSAGTYCAGAGYNITLGGSDAGISYRLYLGTTAVGSPIGGSGSAISFGTFTSPGTYTVRATNPTTGCTSNMTGSASIITGTLPALFTVTGGGSYCAGGAGVVVGLSGTTASVSYRLHLGTTPIGSAITGTGAPISFGLQTAAGTYTVVATSLVSGCTRNMSGSVSITINPLPAAYTVTGGGGYCAGGPGVAVGLSSSNTGISYRLYRGTTYITAVSGTGSAISFGSQTVAGTYTVIAYNTGTGCTSSMAGSATIVVNSIPTISGSIYTVMPGASITLSGSPTGGLWTSGTTTVATIGSSSGVVTGVTLGTTLISYTLSTGCRATRTVAVTPTGFRETPAIAPPATTATEGICVVPNPNKGTFTVKGTFASPDDMEVSYEVADMTGKTIYINRTIVHNGMLEETVNLGNIASGVYLLNVRSNTGTQVFRVIVGQ